MNSSQCCAHSSRKSLYEPSLLLTHRYVFKRFIAGAILVGIGAPRPARGWAVLSGAPGVFSSAILVWGPVPFCPPAGVSRTNHARFFAPTLCTWNGPGLPTWAAPETRLGCIPQWYIHGYHWSGGPPGGWGGPYMVNQNWVWELLWGSRSFPPGAVGGVVWGVVGVGAGSCYAAPWASQLGCARTPIGYTTTQGPRHQIAGRLNARWQTDWAIEDQA